MRDIGIILFIILSFPTTPTRAQVFVGVEGAIPTHTNFDDIASYGYGASVRYEAHINNQLLWTASVGYLRFVPTYLYGSGKYGNHTMVPVAGGIHYYFSGAGRGIYLTADVSLNLISIYGGFYKTTEEAIVGIAPGMGYRLGHFDISARYNFINVFDYGSLRIGYVFGRK